MTAAGLEHVEPIWGRPPMELVREFVETSGRAVITCVDLSRLNASSLGRIIDERFLEEIGATGVDPCGERGEDHSFAPFKQIGERTPAVSITVEFEKCLRCPALQRTGTLH